MNKLITFFAIFLVNPAFGDGFEKIDDKYYAFKQDKYTLVTSKTYPGFMFTNHKMKSLVEVLDTDEDGVVDLLRYTAYAENGVDFIASEDYDMDGEINMRWHHSEDGYMELWYLEKWHRILGRGKELHIVNGQWRIPVISKNGRFVAQTHNKTKH